ncbi:hypothetical protein [Streptomyces johnsoniae]|uniref:Uncharacterized protein n=1 Tax=Streptomyces johnsoniae TaxID=3075532 RepID=A0ABU2RXT0_9ACTN|nr:hypothetical protein [Streptomyces sp. DSM 41886]MDT0441566.1 hypothetical protein [Streptomyces sp. DSM 41886]
MIQDHGRAGAGDGESAQTAPTRSPARTPAETLTFVVAAGDDPQDPGAGGEMGILRRRDESATALRDIPVAVPRRDLGRTVQGLQQVLSEIDPPEGGKRLREAQVSSAQNF